MALNRLGVGAFGRWSVWALERWSVLVVTPSGAQTTPVNLTGAGVGGDKTFDIHKFEIRSLALRPSPFALRTSHSRSSLAHPGRSV